jgi:uncharacterized protein (TIGR00661 family)
MSNILYGVNGEGAGHSTRAKEVIRHLVQQGHRVHVVSFDRGLRNLSDEFEVTEIYGLRFAYVENQVRYGRTVLKNLLSARGAARSLRQLEQLAEQWTIDAVVTDFEPLSARVAHRLKLPLVSIDNQHCLTHARVEYPKRYRKEARAARLVTRFMVPRADLYCITSFLDAPLRKPGAAIVPPILRGEVLRAAPSEGEHILVYLTAPSREIAELLRSVRQRFLCYGFEREGGEGNCVFRRPSLGTFLADLASCRGIVANSGFSLISEALHLGKPYLAVPVKKQFEQIFNAYWIQKKGFGAYWDEVNKERVEAFLFNLDSYREALKSHPKRDNGELFGRLDAFLGRERQAAGEG